MTTISIIKGKIIKDGRIVVPRECQLGLRVENVLEYFSKNMIDLDFSKHNGYISLSMNHYTGKQKLIKALIDDNVIKANQFISA